MLRVDIDMEEEVGAEYGRLAGETDEPDLKKLLLRIGDNEKYHDEVFTDLLKEEEGK